MASIMEHIKTLIKLDVFALGILHLSNQFITSIASSKNMVKMGSGKYYTWQHGDIYYQKTGEGSPIILLHETHPYFSSYVWSEVIDQLSTNHTVYSVDLPGCGRSYKSNIEYTNYFFVLFLNSFIQDVVKEKCEIIAEGYSSSYAIMSAHAGNDKISHITAVNPYSLKDLNKPSGKKQKLASTLISLPVIGTTIYNIVTSRSNIDYHFTEKLMYNPFRSKSRYVDTCYEAAHYNNGAGKYLLSSINGNYLTVNIKNALKEKGDLITILYGEKIENANNIVKAYQRENPDIKAYSIMKTKHLPQLERPSCFISEYNIASAG